MSLPSLSPTRYIVFDVETPNRYNNRMSAIGVSVVENSQIVQEFATLINPETGFDFFNTHLTGISEESVMGSPIFPEVWEQLGPVFDSGVLVAHNAPFDMGVLKKCLHDYGIYWKRTVPYCCTVQIGRRLLPGMSHKLNCMCDYYGIGLQHHHAGSDSHAAAELLIRYMRSGTDIRQYIRRYTL